MKTKENEKIIQWTCKILTSNGYKLKSKLPENVLKTPWSYIARFETSEAYIYLKHMPAKLALESSIIGILHDQFQASVPTVIADNTELNCFLMKDAGRPLREILKQYFDTELLCKAIDQFTALQLATAENLVVFIDIGVPDWRLDKLPHLYMELLSQKDILIEDGLSEKEIIELETLFPMVFKLCKKLSDNSIKQTIVQPDFNDNNTLIDELSQKITIIDLGEIVISHPFFSLINCLQQIKKHHGLTDEDPRYLRIKNACLKNYLDLYSEKQVIDAFAITNSVWPVYWALSNYRLMRACGKDKLMAFQHGRLCNTLREFMVVCARGG
ncbi:hypothetical protein Lgee_0176 [Legionella geestiana]|uniref:Aminoglycoside phosphotransferase family protein n=1 Tax=Legionella geestiana TaxID=45065 RepID=A0A0W0U9W7_9GAMM|nr:aminoglycoside phosphotransferase family protein [Legionella geestiana]KTD04423.1 hypothetical protein Lgee_0176 [Legionella geestiana]STX54575.1 Uncharacterised protein [Legionella geestiana]